MNKGDLIEEMARASGESRAASARVLDALISVLAADLAAGGAVAIAGLGAFKVSHRPARTGRNPRTGESIPIGASKSVRFVPSPAFKKALIQRSPP
jgi:DNA-binding protein HU-beta